MKRPRFGLQARFLCVAAGAVLVVIAIVAVLLARQAAAQRELLQASSSVVSQVFDDSVREQGTSLATSLADALVNPLYFSDLDAIGALVRSTASQKSVSYVLVHDAEGRLIHDGSVEVAGYGRQMQDPLAQGAINAEQLRMQESPMVLEVDLPLRIGEQRIGGLRLGMDLAPVRAQEAEAKAALEQRMGLANRRQLAWVILMMVALVGLACLVALYVQRTLVQPVRWLGATARRIEAGDYQVEQQDTRRGDEIGELLRTFGRMGQSIARHDREVRQMAYTDSLTGLTNRLAFREALDHRLLGARASGQGLALLFIDIDEFKRVNDTLGHEAGDDALLQFAQRIAAAVGQDGGDDALLARFGGDEFVILIGNDAGRVENMATALAKRLVADLGSPLQVQEREIFLGSSIGITLFPEDATDATGLLKNGDIAMYQAKLAGKSCFRYYSRALDHAVERRLHLEQELRGAWERGELHLVYQPIFRTLDRMLIGVEALLRWQHPVLGAIPPSMFIDIAEQSGLIQTLGPKVLHAACLRARQWPCNGAGEELFVSVNVSPRQLRSGDLAAAVEQCLHVSGLAASRLHLELTETAVIGDEMLAASLLEKLHRTGVKVWLDDFGTGFSGLSHLRQVPVDGVKIDKSFVADLQRDPDDLALTSAIIAMAHALGITVVAEGIEHQAQFDLLNERGCDLVQGYWLARPLDSDDLVRLLDAAPNPA
ncbi:putative bifunctional diguanylate cyclase/phosphodiesterase [Stenotrophomonas acidaminiphila]|jgi:diguanylate cyclase (GGDEF)-like protein|uniref:putative bifunctional diguanylate cyclase/phosphodiesterase n=1 Tax=Stenotrophomonas TaxID=40323 RepID=UPI0007026926|nr:MULTISPECIES: EAL domain-containing protein [Stenotrophomonas]KRG84329.1 DeoR faimly transcriptional regulator [Stenotrophomonas acidaminiphila]QOG00148.1 EAL domain-containing protein [Stenotrophomonas sp. CW117]